MDTLVDRTLEGREERPVDVAQAGAGDDDAAIAFFHDCIDHVRLHPRVVVEDRDAVVVTRVDPNFARVITRQVVGVDRRKTVPVDDTERNVADGAEGRAVGAVHLAATGSPVQQPVAVGRGPEHADLHLCNIAARRCGNGMNKIQGGIG
jgi:hypothetical protein